MSSAPSNPALTLYDIKMAPPITTSSCAPNPWKARQALNFKALPFKTTWIDLPDITKTRIALGVPAGRQFADGTDFYTLPVLVNEETGEKIGDSLDIAIYLDEKFPDSGRGRLLPEGDMDFLLEYNYKDTDILVPLSGISATASQAKYAPYAHFNRHVDAAFTAHTLLMAYGMKFVPETAEITKTEFARRASMPSFEAFKIEGEPRRATMESFKTALWDLAQFFIRDTEGPFILGAKPCHADFIVGGWLRFAQVCLHPEEWEEVRKWHGGVFGRVFDELGVFREIK